MKRNVFIYSLVCLCMICASCEKVVTDVEVPNISSKLVVYSFISPDDTVISIMVNQSSPVYSDRRSMLNITDATVVMSSGGVSATATVNSFGQYSIAASALPILVGKSYHLDVTTPDGRHVTADCTVPSARVAVDAAEYLKRPSPDQMGFSEYRLLCKWADQPGIKNYYRLDVNMAEAFDGGVGDTTYRYTEMARGVTDDTGGEGQQLSLLFDQVDQYQSPDDYALDFTLLITDKAYYDYHESRFRYSGEDPFSEPVFVKTNIEGGLGCFGAYIKTTQRVKLQ